MDEYISRKEAIDKMRSLQSRFRAKNDWDSGYDTAIAEAFEHIKRVPVANVQPVNQWISVKDRLPEENILVLCYARSTTGEGNDYFLGALAHGEFWFLKVNDIGHVSYPVLHWEVTHWQPLPESPKED